MTGKNKFNVLRIKLGRMPKYEPSQYKPGHRWVGNPDTLLKKGDLRTIELARVGGLAVKGVRKPPRTKEHQGKLNEATKKRWEDPLVRRTHGDLMKEFWQDPTRLANRSKLSLDLWQDPNFVAKQIRARNRTTPNKVELLLGRLLNGWFPGIWEFVGDGSLVIGGLCPDFSITDGRNLILDLFGNYWHSPNEVNDRIAHFKVFGYDLLVIWDKELKEEEYIHLRVAKFMS